jgi:hypothetical protein
MKTLIFFSIFSVVVLSLAGCIDSSKKTDCSSFAEEECNLNSDSCVGIRGNGVYGYASHQTYFIGCKSISENCNNVISYTWGSDEGSCYEIPNSCVPKDWSVCTNLDDCVDTTCESAFCTAYDETECNLSNECQPLNGLPSGAISSDDRIYLECYPKLSNCSAQETFGYEPYEEICCLFENACIPMGWHPCQGECENTPCLNYEYPPDYEF